ncbi:MAG: nicotinate-nucleotide--dimethylbenzimidazole phosphoribosyltransferase, partial [Lachnospiraceae bacterium]|nr:nicotinate-nucleotide--dimethylbenzimidazole phosphoribosyltransferase [Lachnospiraceae bacterium]
QGSTTPDITKKALVIMCADNGVVSEGVSQTDKSVTASVAELMGKNRSTVGVMLKDYPALIMPIDVGIDSDKKIEGVSDKKVSCGTGNIEKEAAMTKEQCLKAISTGIEAVWDCKDKGVGLIATGEMGIGNTTTSTALFCALTGKEAGTVVGKGAGLTDEGLKIKTKVIEDALKLHGLTGKTTDPKGVLSALASVGGLDIAALCGVFIGAAIYHIPAVIDGAISAVAALAAAYMVSGCEGYMIASHKGREKITGEVLDLLGLKGVIDADMALGEGTGAVLMFPMLDMVMSVYINGTRFGDTMIGQYERFDK